MKVYLYNLYHIGDLLFSQSIVRNLCKKNPEHSFTLFCHNNSSLFSEIEGLTISHELELFIDRDPSLLYFMVNSETIAINLWINSFACHNYITKFHLGELECNMKSIVMTIHNLLEYLRQQENIYLQLDNYDPSTFVPILPQINNSLFEDWHKQYVSSGKLVFYFNYYPKSGQFIPVIDHDTLLFELASAHPHHTFLVPNISVDLDARLCEHSIVNIINCAKQFDCLENPSCDNLCKLEYIAEQCDYSVHFDIGACFYYFNARSPHSKHRILHFGGNNYLFNNISSNAPHSLQQLQFIQAKHSIDVYLKLQDILSLE
jgi:hypothetical protein